MGNLIIGKITGVHGVRGDLKVISYTQPPESIADYQPWQLERTRGAALSFKLSMLKRYGEGLLVKLEGLDDRDEAKALVGSFIVVDRAQLPPLDSGHYWADLIGLTVKTVEGVSLGKVDYLFETGSNDVMVIQGEREHLLPYRPEVVLEVNLQEGFIVVDWDPEF